MIRNCLNLDIEYLNEFNKILRDCDDNELKYWDGVIELHHARVWAAEQQRFIQYNIFDWFSIKKMKYNNYTHREAKLTGPFYRANV